MKKFLFIIVSILLLVSYSSAQIKNGSQKKLAKFYDNQAWEDCAFKAERMILLPKNEKDAEIYLYLAASYNKIFLLCIEDQEYLNSNPEYLESYTYALKHSVTAKKRDKKQKRFFPANDHILEEIAISGIFYIENYVKVKKKPSKANSYARKIMKTYNDDNIYFMHGVLSAMLNDMLTANEVFTEVYHRMDSIQNTAQNIKPQKTTFYMIEAYDYYAEYMLNQEVPKVQELKDFIEKGLSYYPNNEILLYWKEKCENPEADIKKPENKIKNTVLKNATLLNTKEDDEDIEIEEEEETDE